MHMKIIIQVIWYAKIEILKGKITDLKHGKIQNRGKYGFCRGYHLLIASFLAINAFFSYL